MQQHVNQRSATFVRTAVMATLVVMALAITPRQARASRVCAPDGRGCFGTTLTCDKVGELLPGWTCRRARHPSAGDHIGFESNGRPVIIQDGKPTYILSDVLSEKLGNKKLTADGFARLVFADRGSVSKQTLKNLSKEYGIPITK